MVLLQKLDGTQLHDWKWLGSGRSEMCYQKTECGGRQWNGKLKDSAFSSELVECLAQILLFSTVSRLHNWANMTAGVETNRSPLNGKHMVWYST